MHNTHSSGARTRTGANESQLYRVKSQSRSTTSRTPSPSFRKESLIMSKEELMDRERLKKNN